MPQVKKPVKKKITKPMPVRTIRIGDEWEKADKILKKKYNMGVPEYVRDQLQAFIADEKGNGIHDDQGALDV